jgi:hypothetical protein
MAPWSRWSLMVSYMMTRLAASSIELRPGLPPAWSIGTVRSLDAMLFSLYAISNQPHKCVSHVVYLEKASQGLFLGESCGQLSTFQMYDNA